MRARCTRWSTRSGPTCAPWRAPTRHVAIYIGNGHAGWEAANANLFSRGDRALVLATGRFGIGWADSARAMGIEVEVLDFGIAPLDLARVEAALRADTDRTASRRC